MSGVLHEYTCGRCNYFYLVKVRSGEHIGISTLTFRKTKPSKESSIHDYLLQGGDNPCFGEFTIKGQGDKKYLLGIKESLLIK